MSALSAAAQVVRLGGEIGAAAIEGTKPDPLNLARQIIDIGIVAVGPDQLREFLDAAAVARVDAGIDAEMRG